MRRLNRVVSGIYDRAFRPIGLTASQVSILVVLARLDRPKPEGVCVALEMDKSTLCRNVQRMQRRGWVRTAATDDARSHRLEVTETGRAMIERALPLWRGAQAKAREVLGDAVVDQLFQAVNASFSTDRLTGRAVSGDQAVPEPVTSSARYEATGSLGATGQVLRIGGQREVKGIFFWE